MVNRAFTDLASLERYVQKQIAGAMSNTKVEDIFQEAMHETIEINVYEKYTPKRYERREDDGGFLDKKTMKFSTILHQSQSVLGLFENMARGNTQHTIPAKSGTLAGRWISKTIEEGLKASWYSEGEWSEPRPFTTDTAKLLNTKYQARLKKELERYLNGR